MPLSTDTRSNSRCAFTVFQRLVLTAVKNYRLIVYRCQQRMLRKLR